MNLTINTQQHFKGKLETNKNKKKNKTPLIIATGAIALGAFVYAKKTNKLEKVSKNVKDFLGTINEKIKYAMVAIVAAITAKNVDKKDDKNNPCKNDEQPDNNSLQEEINKNGENPSERNSSDELSRHDLHFQIESQKDASLSDGKFDKFLQDIKDSLKDDDTALPEDILSLQFDRGSIGLDDKVPYVDFDNIFEEDEMDLLAFEQEEPVIIRTSDGYKKISNRLIQDAKTSRMIKAKIEEEYKNNKLLSRAIKDLDGSLIEFADFEKKQVMIPNREFGRQTVYDFRRKRIYDYIFRRPNEGKTCAVKINPKLKLARITISGIQRGLLREFFNIENYAKEASERYEELSQKYVVEMKIK